MTRRHLLRTLGSASAVLAAGCASSATDPSATSSSSTGTNGTSTSGTATTSGACVVSPSETGGPYPDRTGMIGNSAFDRRDIREGKSGLPLTLVLTLVNVSSACSPVANASVEIWQCDADGHYSEYSQAGFDGTGQTFLRGVQTIDAGGQVTFTTIYPGWYAGRATHIHVEVFVSGRSVKTTQIAFPESVTAAVYRSGVYAAKGQNTTSNASDNVFSDGVSNELASLAGDTVNGYTAALTVGV